MRYRLADIAQPETLIAEAKDFFAEQRVIGISCIGVAYLVPDAVLAAVLQALHAWSAPGSVLALTFGTWVEGGDRAHAEASIEVFKRQANAAMHVRTNEELIELAGPWRVTEIRSLPDWLDVPDMFSREELESQGASMAGAFFEH
jgi:hypothetical protein